MVYSVYMQRAFSHLPTPRSAIPFHQQANPIPDPLQVHFAAEQAQVADSAYDKPNTLSYDRFLGTVWEQNNQPKFLSANERVVFEKSW